VPLQQLPLRCHLHPLWFQIELEATLLVELLEIGERLLFHLAVLQKPHSEWCWLIIAFLVVLDPKFVVARWRVGPVDVLAPFVGQMLVARVHVNVQVPTTLSFLVIPEDVLTRRRLAVQV